MKINEKSSFTGITAQIHFSISSTPQGSLEWSQRVACLLAQFLDWSGSAVSCNELTRSQWGPRAAFCLSWWQIVRDFQLNVKTIHLFDKEDKSFFCCISFECTSTNFSVLLKLFIQMRKNVRMTKSGLKSSVTVIVVSWSRISVQVQ